MCEKEKKNVQKATDDFVLRQPLPPVIKELLRVDSIIVYTTTPPP